MSITWISEHFRYLFLPLGLCHFLLFVSLFAEHRHRLSVLRTFVRNLASRVVQHWSDERPDSTIAEELDILLHDLHDALATGLWDPERANRIRDAVFAADAPRSYLYEIQFEKRLSLAKAIIETYPLLGIVGTVLAIAAGMQSVAPPPKAPAAVVRQVPGAPSAMPSIAPVAEEALDTSENDLKNVTQNFGHSVWTTLIGLSLAIIFAIINSWLEPEFNQVVEYRKAIGEVMHQMKSRLDGPIKTPAAVTRGEARAGLGRRTSDS